MYRLVTPELALLYLSKNDGNRPIDERRVRDFEEDMRAGRWREKGGVPIIITPTGELLNGQHRLNRPRTRRSFDDDEGVRPRG